MFRKTRLFLFGGGVALAGLLMGCGHWMHQTPEKKAEYFVEEISEELELTAEQLTKLNALKEHLLGLYKEHQSKREAKHAFIRNLTAEPQLNQQALLDHINQKTDYVRELAPDIVVKLAAFYDSLNTEQQEVVREFVEKCIKKHNRWHS